MAHSDLPGNDASTARLAPSGEAEYVVTSLVSGFFHGGIAVSDMERSLAFYRDLLGLEVHFDVTLDAVEYVRHALGIDMRDCRIVYLRVPGSEGVFVELLEYHGTDARPTAEPRPWDPGTGHLCLYVTDTQGVLDRAVEAGYRARSTSAATIPLGPNRGALAGWLIDPDGYHIELFQRPPTPAA
jgi:catechol 2,3-dioxygenase-like lactoylglutathione lyase family enzyme